MSNFHEENKRREAMVDTTVKRRNGYGSYKVIGQTTHGREHLRSPIRMVVRCLCYKKAKAVRGLKTGGDADKELMGQTTFKVRASELRAGMIPKCKNPKCCINKEDQEKRRIRNQYKLELKHDKEQRGHLVVHSIVLNKNKDLTSKNCKFKFNCRGPVCRGAGFITMSYSNFKKARKGNLACKRCRKEVRKDLRKPTLIDKLDHKLFLTVSDIAMLKDGLRLLERGVGHENRELKSENKELKEKERYFRINSARTGLENHELKDEKRKLEKQIRELKREIGR